MWDPVRRSTRRRPILQYPFLAQPSLVTMLLLVWVDLNLFFSKQNAAIVSLRS
jgi:hypothetical protein